MKMNPSRKIVALCALLWAVLGSASPAQEIVSYPEDKYPVGTTFVFRDDFGGTEWLDDVVLVERQPDRIRFEVTGRPPAEPNMHSVIVNGEGNVMEVVYASGRKVTYRPHNCSRVIGECEYMLSRNDGAPERRRSRAVMSGGVREGMLFDDRGFIMVESRITFDADWVAVRMVRRQPNTTDPRWSVRELVEVIPPKP